MIAIEGSTRRILSVLVREGGEIGMRLGEIAKAVGLAHTTVLAHLKALAREQWVDVLEVRPNIAGPNGARRGATYTAYRAARTTSVQWVDRNRGVLERWESVAPVDWRFPLVTRVPDHRAQVFLLEWLDRAQSRGLLPTYRSRFEPTTGRSPLVRIAVYGSCARGDAGAKADLDLLILSNVPFFDSGELVDLAHEVALEHPRAVDVQFLLEPQRRDLPPEFQENLAREAKTVWMNDADAELVEDPLGVRLGT